MLSKATDKRLRSRISNAPLFVALCGLLVVMAAGTALAGLPQQGKRPPQQAKKLGQTKHTPSPLCPQRPSEKRQQRYFDNHPGAATLPANLQTKHACQAVGSVTGFQIKADGKKQAFRVPHNARIVAWAVSVANTNHFEEKAFGKKLFPSDQFGPDPQAQLAILKKMKHDGPRFKLIRNSPTVKLNSAQGHKQYFVLKKPLKAKKGMIVGISMPTWAPIIASNTRIQKNNKWRASRKNCSNNDATHARPQLKKKSVRQYACIFPDRLLYWAYYIRGLGKGHNH